MRAYGYTLLELLITLSISSILFAIGIPSFSQLIASQKSTLASNRLVGAVNFTRFQAVSLGKTVSLCPKLTNNSCGRDWSKGILIFEDDDKNGKLEGDEQLIREVIPIDDGASLRWTSFGSNNYLRYTATGFTLNQNGSFIYCPSDQNEHFARVIVINRAGRVRHSIDRDGNGVVERTNGRDVTC